MLVLVRMLPFLYIALLLLERLPNLVLLNYLFY